MHFALEEYVVVIGTKKPTASDDDNSSCVEWLNLLLCEKTNCVVKTAPLAAKIAEKSIFTLNLYYLMSVE